MSACIVVSIEGVLTDPSEDVGIPTAAPSIQTVGLVQAFADRWPIGYVTTASRAQAETWLKEVRAPSGMWIIAAPLDFQGDAILKMLAERRDRAEFMLTSDAAHLSAVVAARVPMLLYRPTQYALGDWRRPSSWGEEAAG